MSRLRSDAKNKGYVLGTCNPSANHWLLKWVDWWLDDEGYPDKEKTGIIRYYFLVDGEPKFFDTEKEAVKAFPHMAYLTNPNNNETVYVPPKTFTFIGGTMKHTWLYVATHIENFVNCWELPLGQSAA